MAKVREQYRRREIEYPVEYVMDVTVGQAGLKPDAKVTVVN